VERAVAAYTGAVNSTLEVEMRASRRVMDVFTKRPGLLHTALTALPPVWRGLDSYIGGTTTIPALLSTPVARAALTTATFFA
jgi:hypothetical protein